MKAFLDAGAKAVIASSVEPDTQIPNGGDLTPVGRQDTDAASDAGRFVIADDEEEDEDEPCSPGSDWEDSDADRREGRMERQQVEEKELGAFVGALYDALFRQGSSAEAALQLALETHPKHHYKCMLPPT